TRLARFQARAERAFYRALREMRELQTNRALLAKHDPAARDQPVPALASVAELTKRTQPAAKPIEEMLAHLDCEAELLLQSRCSSGLPAGHSDSRLLTSAAQ